MKVLITGASGFIGSHVLASLSRHGIGFVATGRRQPATVSADAFLPSDLLAMTGDRFAELIAASGATHLLHLAWYAEHGQYWRSPINLRWVDATVKLAEAFCQAGGSRVVVAGTCAEYAWTDAICDECRTSLLPATLYGVTKDATRRLVEAVCRESQVSCAWGRVFLPFGAGESSQRLVPSLIDALTGKRPPFAVDAAARRDFMHASDVAEAFVTLLESCDDGAFNIGSGDPVSIETVVRELATQLRVDPTPMLALASRRSGELALLAGDISRLRSLGFAPRHTLHSALAQTLADRRHANHIHRGVVLDET